MSVKEYKNDDVTITWELSKCIHSENCWRGLSSVFKPKNKPWIDANGASSEAIMAQIDQCPSGALGHYKNSEGPKKEAAVSVNSKTVVAEKSPVNVELEGGKPYAWCACGRSVEQPFCDGTHNQTDLKPLVFKPKEQGGAWLCQCKQTKNPPYCDGTHNKL